MAYEPRGDYGGDRGGQGQDGQMIKVRGRRKLLLTVVLLTLLMLIVFQGPVTDYSATLLHWQRNRVPNYKGSYIGESERPSCSYIVDVGCVNRHASALN